MRPILRQCSLFPHGNRVDEDVGEVLEGGAVQKVGKKSAIFVFKNAFFSKIIALCCFIEIHIIHKRVGQFWEFHFDIKKKLSKIFFLGNLIRNNP